ncbi:MAG TPA: hypothetical protein EYP68_07920 [Candidatus Korarchaeota archaeon]|nr:hypothetical protein [Candidatus Korarchaeota archaeon]
MKVLDFHVHPTIGYKYAKEEKNPREFAEKLYVDTSYSILNIVKQYKLAEYIFILDSKNSSSAAMWS